MSRLEDESIKISYANAFWLTVLTHWFTFGCWRQYSQPDEDGKEKAFLKKSQASFTVSRQLSSCTGPQPGKEHWFSIIAWFPVTAFGNVFEFFKRSKEETISSGLYKQIGEVTEFMLFSSFLLHIIIIIKKKIQGLERWLNGKEDLGLGTHMITTISNSSFRGPDALFLTFGTSHSHGMHLYMWTKYHTYKENKLKKNFKKSHMHFAQTVHGFQSFLLFGVGWDGYSPLSLNICLLAFGLNGNFSHQNMW